MKITISYSIIITLQNSDHMELFQQ